jgi:hypothetical protein
MITGIEFPYLLALLYPSLNYVWLFPKLKPSIEKEIQHEPLEMDGVVISDYHMETAQPVYVNVNNIMLPVGGGLYKEKKLLLTKHISKDKSKDYFNFSQIEDTEDIKQSLTKVSHINTQDALVKTFKYYKIPTDRFAINLPLEVKYYNYKNGFYIHKLGYIASNKDRLVKDVLWRKRMPLTMTIPTIAGTGLFCCWFYYALDSAGNYYYKDQYYPPLHPKRIKSYFKGQPKTSSY